MSKPTDIRIVSAECNFEPVPFRMPLKFGGRVVDQTDLINVRVTVETDAGRSATGYGSMPVGNIWAWPSTTVSAPLAESVMKDFAVRVTETLASMEPSGDPVSILFDFADEHYGNLAASSAQALDCPEPMPRLAQLVAASPLDAAVHDAYGRVHEASSFTVLSRDFMNRDLGTFLDEQFAGEYLDRYVSRKPQATMPLYHLVGALDPLTPGDIATPIDDGLPVSLDEWIRADGLTHLKIKLAGDNLDWDVDRVLSTDRVTAEAQAERGCSTWFYSVDFNEKCENVEYVLEFLNRVRQGRGEAYDRIQYIEQPTHRDLKSHPDNTMHAAAKLKPVVIDESLVNYEALLLAREQGYSGVALKACKGQTEALLAAAAAQKFGMFLCVQDLTCPGASFLHSASLAAHIPTVAAIEGNARQYCPAPNAPWASLYPGMFDIRDGRVQTGSLDGPGLGFAR